MNASHLIIFNRTAADSHDGWIHIVPKGELPNREAGISQVLDDQSLDAIMAKIDRDKARLGNRWPGIYGGEEHFYYQDDKSTAAFAWFKEFQKREDGIWAKADGLTDLGEEAIKNKRFKFTSFVTDRSDTEQLDGNRVRILGIDTVGFTNQANGKELLTPITNRDPISPITPISPLPFPRGSSAAAVSQTTKTKDIPRMKSVATKLGLAADASEEAVLAEVSKILNRATDAESQVAPLTERVKTLESANATLLHEQIQADFAAAGIKDDKIINRHIPLLSDPKHFKNRDERLAFLHDLVPAATTAAKPQIKLLNRDAKAPTADPLATDEPERVKRAEAAIADYRIKNRCSYNDARNTVRRLNPELFGPNS